MPAIFSTKHPKWLHYKCMTNRLTILFIIPPRFDDLFFLAKPQPNNLFIPICPPSNKAYNWDDTLQRTNTIQLCTYTYNQYQHNAAPLSSPKNICHPYWVAELRTLFLLCLFHQHKVNPDMKPTRINRLTVVNQKLPCWPQTKLCN